MLQIIKRDSVSEKTESRPHWSSAVDTGTNQVLIPRSLNVGATPNSLPKHGISLLSKYVTELKRETTSSQALTRTVSSVYAEPVKHPTLRKSPRGLHRQLVDLEWQLETSQNEF